MNNDNGKAYYGIGLDNSQLQQDAEEASRILSNIGTEAEQQSSAVREALSNLPELNIEIITNATTTADSIDAAFAEIDRVFEENKSAIVQLEKEYNRLKKEASDAFMAGDDKTYRALMEQANAVKQVISARQKMNKEVAETADELAKEEKRMKEEAAQVQQSEKAHSSLRQRLREVKMELVEMEAAGQRGSAEYRALQEEAAALTDAWGDAQAQANILANDQRGMQGIISGLSGVSGAFTAAQGAVGLFAGENEHLQQIMLKVQSLMAITMGLQQVQQTLNKDSAFSLVTLNGLKEWWNKLVAVGTGEQVAETAATAASTTASAANAAATTAEAEAKAAAGAAAGGKTTAEVVDTAATGANAAAATAGTAANITLAGAFRMVGAAISSIPVFGWIAAAIGVLIGVISHFVSKANEASKRLEEQQELVKEGRKAYAEASMEIQNYSARIESFNGTKEQEKQLVEELNQKYGSSLGYYDSLGKWKDVLKTKGQAYCEMLLMESQAQAILNKYTEAYINLLETKEKAKNGDFKHWYQTKAGDQAAEDKAIAEAQAEVDRWKTQYKDLQNQIREFKSKNDLDFHIDPKAVNINGSGSGSTFDPKKASAETKLAIARYKAEVAKYIKDSGKELTDLIIEGQEEGLMKELNGIRRDTQRKLEAWQEQLNELAKVRQQTAKELYMNSRGATEEGWNNSDDGKKTLKDWIAVLYEENPQIQTEFQRVWEQIVKNGETALANARQEFDDAMIEEYGTMQQKEEKLLRDWTIKLNTIPAEYLPAAMQKMEEEFAALGSEKFKKAIDWESVFGDMSKQSVSVLRYNLEKVREYFEQNKNSMSVTEIKDYQEAITKMEEEIAARNPFAALYKSLSDLEKAKTEYVESLAAWKEAQNELNAANEEFMAALTAKNEVLEQIDNGELAEGCDELTEAETRLQAARQRSTQATEKNNTAEQRTLRARNGITNSYKSFATSLQGVGKVVTDLGNRSKNLAAIFSDSVASAIGKAIDFTEEVMDATSTVISAIGDIGKDVADGVETAVDAAAQGATAAAATGATAISTIEKASVILAVISAALQVATAIANLFNNDDKKQEEIERLQERIDQLQWELDNQEAVRLQENAGKALTVLKQLYGETTQEVLKLHGVTAQSSFWQIWFTQARNSAEIYAKSVSKIADYWANVSYTADKALGSAKYDESRKQLENLAEQQILIQKQINEEQSKKKTDNGKIQEWQNQISEIAEEMATIINEMLEDIIGFTASDLSSELGNAFFEAARKGEDAMEAWHTKVNDIIRDIIQRMLITQFLEPEIGKIFDKYKQKWFPNGQFAGIDAVINSAQNMGNDLNRVGDIFNQIYGGLSQGLQDLFAPTEEASREASEKGIATASQESVDELNGRATAIQGHTFSIAESTKQLVVTANLILESVLNIERETIGFGDRLTRMESNLRGVLNTLDEISLKGLKLR